MHLQRAYVIYLVTFNNANIMEGRDYTGSFTKGYIKWSKLTKPVCYTDLKWAS